MSEPPKLILIAIIASPHGIKGEVHLKSFAEDPFSLLHYQPLYDETGKEFIIKQIRLHKTKIIAKIDGVNSRNEAQTCQGIKLFVERQSFADELAEDEFYQTDLIGFRVFMLEQFRKSVKRFCDKNCGKTQEPEQFVRPNETKTALDNAGQAGEEIGRVVAFFNFGAGDLMEINHETGRSWIIPFSQAAVPIIDMKEKVMMIDPLASGIEEERKPTKKPPRQEEGG